MLYIKSSLMTRIIACCICGLHTELPKPVQLLTALPLITTPYDETHFSFCLGALWCTTHRLRGQGIG